VNRLWTVLGRELVVRVDEDLIGRLTDELNVDPNEVRAWLDTRRLRYVSQGHPPPSMEELQASAGALTRRCSRRAALSGAIAGWAGLAGVPAEIGVRLLLTVRLAQQLAIVYGHDPATDKGRIQVRRALAHTYELELPVQQAEGMGLRDLGALVRRQGDRATRSTWLARAAAQQTRAAIGSSLLRKIPVIGLAPGALTARRTLQAHGKRMEQSLAQAVAWPSAGIASAQDAVEVG
jgi:hypothetical protein